MEELNRLVGLYNNSLSNEKRDVESNDTYSRDFAKFLVKSADESLLSEILIEYKYYNRHKFETSDDIPELHELPLFNDIVKKKHIISTLSDYVSELIGTTLNVFNSKKKYTLSKKQYLKANYKSSDNIISDWTKFGDGFCQMDSSFARKCSKNVYISYSYDVGVNKREHEVKRLIRSVRGYATSIANERNELSNEYEELKHEYVKFLSWKLDRKVDKSRYDVVEKYARTLIDENNKQVSHY